MSNLNGQTILCGQSTEKDIELVIFGDEYYARYETKDGYTVIYDTGVGAYCFVALHQGHFVSTGSKVGKPIPPGISRHLKEHPNVRNEKFEIRYRQLQPTERQLPSNIVRTMGPDGGLLEGRKLTHGEVKGLTVLVNFKDIKTNIKLADVDTMLNGSNYNANGNYCSAREYFEIVSSGKLKYTNKVVGPVQLRHSRSYYINRLLVEEALDLARAELSNEGLDLKDFDSRGEGIVDALNILYAGQTQYSKNLWPHNSVKTLHRDNVRTHFYLLTSLGREKVDLNIGTFCHENGHLLCRFPDLYDYGGRDGDSEESEGIGRYCLMGSGNHNNRGRTPSPVNAYLRDLAGWTENEISLNSPGQVNAVHGDYSTVIKYKTDRSNEYFIIENRTKQELDGGLPDSGLAVYHCDTLGSNEWQDGTRTRHYQCAVLQADGHLDLENNINRGDGDDLFPETTGVALSNSTTPNTREWDGSDSGLIISDISAQGGTIQFVAGAPSETVFEYLTVPDLLIPDNDPNGVQSLITIPTSGEIKNVEVTVDIIHTWIGDLIVKLEAPDGTMITLHDREGQNGDDIEKTYDETSNQSLNDLHGKSMRGSWKLHVADLAGQDIGRINTFGLRIEYNPTAQGIRKKH